MNFNIGKLYQVKKYYWFLYPTKDIAACNLLEQHAVSDISPNSIFCLLEKDGNFLKVLSTSGELGWMVCPSNEDKGCIEEVNQ